MTTPAEHPEAITISHATLRRQQDPPEVPGWDKLVEVAYSAWIGHGDMLHIALNTPAMLGGQDLDRPWSACIWPGHEDGEKHWCDRWCNRTYRTAAEAAGALDREYTRRENEHERRGRELAAAREAARQRDLAKAAARSEADTRVLPSPAFLAEGKETAFRKVEALLREEAALVKDASHRRGLNEVAEIADCWRDSAACHPDTCDARSRLTEFVQMLTNYSYSMDNRCVAEGYRMAARIVTKVRDALPRS